MSKHIFAKSKRCKASVLLVDTAGIEGKKMQLPGEVSETTSMVKTEKSAEVIVISDLIR
jgi:signal recognition particle GTPase